MPRSSTTTRTLSRATKQTISFGMISIGVEVKSLAESKAKTTVSANFICPVHKEQIKNKKWCETGSHEVDAIKAFNHEGQWVVIDESLLDQIVAEKTGELKIDRFVPLEQIDPIYFKSAYIVAPQPSSTGPYDLLGWALREAQAAAVGSAVFGGAKATQLIVIRWSAATESLVAHTCVYDDALRWSDVDVVADAAKARPAPPKEQLDLATQIVTSMGGDFDPTVVVDAYNAAKRDLIAQAAAGNTPIAAAPAVVQQAPAEDLMAALRASIEQATGKPAAAKKPAAKKPPAKKKTTA